MTGQFEQRLELLDSLSNCLRCDMETEDVTSCIGTWNSPAMAFCKLELLLMEVFQIRNRERIFGAGLL